MARIMNNVTSITVYASGIQNIHFKGLAIYSNTRTQDITAFAKVKLIPLSSLDQLSFDSI